MPLIQETPITVEGVLDAVAKLSPAEQARFERGLTALRQRRLSLKEKVARRAKFYRFLPKQKDGQIILFGATMVPKSLD